MRKTARVAVLLLVAVAVSAQTPKLGVGGFAGVSIPLAQDDQAQGTVFGLRAKLSLNGFLAAEGQIGFTKWGKPDPIDGLDLGIDGSKITQFGVNGILGGGAGPGIKPYFLGGFGSYKIKNDDTQFDESRMGYNGGLGLGIGLGPKFSLDARGEAVVIPMDGGGSKKAVVGSAGLTLYF
jgi:opacity protein-like surface antigen